MGWGRGWIGYGDEIVLFTLYRWYFADNLYVPGLMIECRFTRALLGVHCTLAYIAGLCNICAWISRDCTLAWICRSRINKNKCIMSSRNPVFIYPYYTLHPTTHFHLLHTYPYYSLMPTTHFTLLHTSPYYTLHPTAHFTLLHTSPYYTLPPTTHLYLLYTSPYYSPRNILLYTRYSIYYTVIDVRCEI